MTNEFANNPNGSVMSQQVNGSQERRADRLDSGTKSGPAVLRHQLGTELRRLREASSLRLEDVATGLGLAPSTLSRIETGKAPARTSYVYTMLDIYGVHDSQQRRALIDTAREGQRKSWWA
jgi:ribosome-binding protein aMBF1 (putative translation factor)